MDEDRKFEEKRRGLKRYRVHENYTTKVLRKSIKSFIKRCLVKQKANSNIVRITGILDLRAVKKEEHVLTRLLP